MKKYISLFLIGLITLSSCDKDLEQINVNPDQPLEVSTNGLFNNTNKELMTNTRGGMASGRMALSWIQYSAQRNYTAEDRYQFRNEVNNNLYINIFLAVKGYKQIIDIVENPANTSKVETYGDPVNQLAAARIMIAYAQLQLVDMYGDVPYYSYGTKDSDFQAMTLGTDGEIATPKFAPQEKIYVDLMKELKEAAQSINMEANSVFNSGDFLFKTPLKLKKFANSLRLKIANRVKDVIPQAKDHLTELTANVDLLLQSNDDNVGLQFQNDRINPAPFFTNAFLDKRNDFSPSNTFVELLKGETKTAHPNPFSGVVDPRLFKMVAPISQKLVNDKGEEVEVTLAFYYNASNPKPSIEKEDYVDRTPDFYQGMPLGIADAITGSQADYACQFSSSIYKADYTEILMEYAEVAFILAELGISPQENFVNGIKASMKRWKVAETDIDHYLSQVNTVNPETILTQKYIALFLQPYEAWAEYRRTQYPKTVLLPGQTHSLLAPGPQQEKEYTFTPLNGLSDLPERITYSTNLNLVNKTNKDEAAARMGGDLMNTKLIWAR
ncbi:SusD/RagB family nutrient-binding outer membrane lipoprotein [Myroides sp. WP-1]|uniref:SusD/RagB family nutrient-binding outer membrane lipoprotein n=1 Tax=Myroides sp. WP-1 TaxID=2759944 RepID=UPI0015F9C9EC|nr:SusD/RagB family nutrient-binding outer membrane lipoprotein [Myroides sp. WP-1]MBB1139753.1 SusD/RagB family nutrient-binding outer membrane lipoprotein [Myroides sp. WP-1]